MKLCVSTLACPDWNLEQIITAAADAGLQGIDFRGVGAELDITRLSAFTSGLADTLASLRANRLVMPCINTSVALLTVGGQKWEAMLEEFARYVKLAAVTGTGFLRIFGGYAPNDMPREHAVAVATRHLRQLLKMTAGVSCIPLLETHDDWVTSGQVMELLGRFDAEEAGVIWDVEHPYRKGEPPQQTVAGLGEYLRHVHFKDGLVRGERRHSTLLGQGDLPLKDCYESLRRVGYDGWICLETEKRWDASAPDPEVSLPQFVQFMRNL
jgi:sugar phosphate isomerase/epimerase